MSFNRVVLTASVAIVSCSFALDICAQEESLEEIVVTAQKRSENLQNVPITISAMSEETLASAGVSTLGQLSTLVAGYQGPGDNGSNSPHIRGVGAVAATVGTDGPIAYYLDGIYLGTPNTAMLDLNNIAGVEILKGPQGTLFGRNTTGGAVLITTPTPGDKFEANVQGGYGNYNTVDGSAYVAGPLSDSVSADFSIQAKHQGEGFGRNLYNGEDIEKLGHEVALRSKWVFKFDTDTKLTVTGYYSVYNDFGLETLEAIPGQSNQFGQFPVGNNPWNVNEDDVPTSHTDTYGFYARLDHDLGFAMLSNLTSYNSQYSYVKGTDYDGTPVSTIGITSTEPVSQFSEELQLVSPSGEHFSWTTGLYYYHGNESHFYNLEIRPLLQPAFGIANTTDYLAEVINSASGYLQATYNIIADTRLTGGIRYTWEHLDAQDGFETFTAIGTGAVTGLPAAPPEPDLTYHPKTWRVALDHDFTHSILGYVSVNDGFKSGGFNLGTPTGPGFLPETIIAYEAGLKNTLLNDRLRLDGSGFYYNYKDLQVTTFNDITTIVYNGAKAKMYGVDLDFAATLIPHLQIMGSTEYLHATFASFPNAVLFTPVPPDPPLVLGGYTQSVGSATGNTVPNAPKFTGSLTAIYDIPTIPREMGNWQLSSTYFYSDSYYFEPDNRLRQPGFNKVSASLLYTDPTSHYTVRLWGLNLTNAVVADYEATSLVQSGRKLGNPRTYGIEFGYKY